MERRLKRVKTNSPTTFQPGGLQEEALQSSVVGTYETVQATEGALRTLARSAFPIEQVSVVAKDLAGAQQVHGFVTSGNMAARSAGQGVWLGGLFGLLIGAAFVWLPGFGPLIVAGPFAKALLSRSGFLSGSSLAALGVGGLLGALAGWGVPRQAIAVYEDTLARGHYLLITHGTPEQVSQAHVLLQQTDAARLEQHGLALNSVATPHPVNI